MSDIPAAPASARDLPRSVVNGWDPLLFALIIIVPYATLAPLALPLPILATILIVLATVVMVPLALLKAPWRGTPRSDVPKLLIFERVAIKWLGIMLGVGLMLLGWGLIHEYRSPYSAPLFYMMPYVLPVVPFAVAAVVYFTEWRLGPSEDHSWQFGLLALGRWNEVNWTVARNGLFGWIVKGFFMPMNFCTAVQYMNQLHAGPLNPLTLPWVDAQLIIMKFIFLILLIAILPGYVFSSRLLGTQNRRVDATAFGWFVTFLCYPPINQGSGGWFFYHAREGAGNSQTWITLTGGAGDLSYILGGLIILCELIHYWSEAMCGLRSSHLSHRGIITNGIFRVTKHPVYAIKCVGWALMWLPFCAADNPLDDLRLTLGFLGFCFIYVLRSYIEERLLSSDAAYIAYAKWMEQHSIFRALGRAVPFFNYSWRLQYWLKRGQVKIVPQGVEGPSDIAGALPL